MITNDQLIECSECGHLHFHPETRKYIACPLSHGTPEESCDCPMNQHAVPEQEIEDEVSFLCSYCEERYSHDDSSYYISETSGETFCDTCWYEQFNEASTAWLVEGDEITKYLVTEHGTFTSEDLETVENVLVRGYHATDGWRGYYETKPLGDWKEAATGWTTGNWGDSISDGKQAFNRWVEAVLHGEVTLDHPVWLIADLTSNVFSTAVGVFIPTDVEDLDVPAF